MCDNESILPNFIKIETGELILVEQRMGEKQANALKNMLKEYKGKSDRDRIVEKLIIDDCSIRDNILAIILESV